MSPSTEETGHPYWTDQNTHEYAYGWMNEWLADKRNNIVSLRNYLTPKCKSISIWQNIKFCSCRVKKNDKNI